MKVPVMTMEEFSVLTEPEREDFLRGLREAEDDVAAGRSRPFDVDSFVNEMMQRRAAYLANKKR